MTGRFSAALFLSLAVVTGARAQTFPTDDPNLRALWHEGMEASRAAELAQVLMDSLGPRLIGTPTAAAAADWVARSYRSWGIEARQEPYGTWKGWRRGVTHADLVRPRVRTLDATMLAWSPGTEGPVSGEVVIVPHLDGPAALADFLEGVRGRFVLLSAPEPSCRPEESWERWATPESLERARSVRAALRADWVVRMRSTGASSVGDIARMLEDAGAAGVLSSEWPEAWGVQRVFAAATERTAPHLGVTCEDYGLLWRLAEQDQGPVLTVDADAAFLGEVPVANTIGMIRGAELPDEYVVLSAHFDSWDGASGATDNGTGTVMMMEAMRILKAVVPRPRRTILVGHWNGEEQGLNGSRAFVADHPEVVADLQAIFNQDNGTGRITSISAMGMVGAGARLEDWLSRIPSELTDPIALTLPGSPQGGGSDYASFICAGVPTFPMSALAWDYGGYTWHSDLDTFDKVVFDDLRNNATLVAMLAYLASEAPERVPRTRVTLPDGATGEPASWPTCEEAERSFVR